MVLSSQNEVKTRTKEFFLEILRVLVLGQFEQVHLKIRTRSRSAATLKKTIKRSVENSHKWNYVVHSTPKDRVSDPLLHVQYSREMMRLTLLVAEFRPSQQPESQTEGSTL